MDRQDIAFHELYLLHDCGQGLLSKHRNPVSDVYTLRCPCGLEVEILPGAQKEIVFTAIDEQARTLCASDAQANRSGPITVSAARQ